MKFDPSRVGKALRFLIVGSANALIYAGVTLLCANILMLNPSVSSGLGYVAAVPLAFMAHRVLTFSAAGAISPQFIKFVGTQILGFCLSITIAWLVVDLLDYPMWAGIGAAIVIVPVATYFLMDKWVFGSSQQFVDSD